MPKIRTKTIEIEYEIQGEGAPLLLIAGLGYTRWSWHRIVPELARRFQVITFDNRGMGGTERTDGPYTAQLLANDTAALLGALGIERAHIAGISMGGFIAQALALKKPELFQSLILMSTSFGGDKHVPASSQVISELINPNLDLRGRTLIACNPNFESRDPEFFKYWLQYRKQNPPHPAGYQSQLAIGLDLLKPENSFESGLKLLDIPTLILFGEMDQVVPVANGQLLQKSISGSRLVTLPEAGHFLPFEAPMELVQEIEVFLSSHSFTSPRASQVR